MFQKVYILTFLCYLTIPQVCQNIFPYDRWRLLLVSVVSALVDDHGDTFGNDYSHTLSYTPNWFVALNHCFHNFCTLSWLGCMKNDVLDIVYEVS